MESCDLIIPTFYMVIFLSIARMPVAESSPWSIRVFCMLNCSLSFPLLLTHTLSK